MAKRERSGQRCVVEGCKNFVVRGEEFCSPHLQQYHNNLAVGAPDPRPTRLGRNRRMCRARNCRHIAIPFSHYCAVHAAQYQDPKGSVEAIAAEFGALMERLNETAPDCLAGVQQEIDLLKRVRRILAAYAEASNRSGWKAISAITFARLWLSSAATANDLLKTQFLMENASGGEMPPGVAEAYEELEKMPGLRQITEGGFGQGEQGGE